MGLEYGEKGFLPTLAFLPAAMLSTWCFESLEEISVMTGLWRAVEFTGLVDGGENVAHS
jgi:hypothetical protein